jgi:glycosyltransferase involved in cell wall biosynthesis
MRLAYVCMDAGVPVLGRKGCSIHVQEVIRALGRVGIEIDLFAARTEGEYPSGWQHVRIHEIPLAAVGGRAERERAAVAANNHLTAALEYEGPFDLIYERYSLWSYAGMEFACAFDVPGLLEVNAPLIEEQTEFRGLTHRDKAEEIAERAFAAASVLIAVSEEVAAYLETYTSARDKVTVIPNGVDPERIKPGLIPAWRMEGNGFKVGFVGSLKPWHGLPILVDAFHRLHLHDAKSRLLIVGDGPELAQLSADIKQRGLENSSHLTGSVSPDQVPKWLASMDVAVAPYPLLPRFYFSPLKVFEYMAAGLPVVASSVGQIVQIIQHDVNGLLYPPGDPAALTAALQQLAADPELRLRLGREARKTVLRNHTWDQVIRRILKASTPGASLDASLERLAIS